MMDGLSSGASTSSSAVDMVESLAETKVAEADFQARCLLCDFSAPTAQKLKSHLLLKHPKSNFCLFCVGKKGWSDDFASPSQYDEHYK